MRLFCFNHLRFALQLDADGNGFISVEEIGKALEVVGHKLPAYQIRDLVKEFDTNIKDGKIDIEEFKMVSSQNAQAYSSE